jgi:hypothetical protein
MSVNIRQTAIALAYRKQTDLVTPNVAGGMWGITKVNNALMNLDLKTEDNAADIGKADEFPTDVFLTNWDNTGQFDKYLSSQFAAHAFTFGLSDVVKTSPGAGAYQYVCTPQDPVADGIELDAFSVVEKVGGIDRILIGNVVEGIALTFASGPGRANAKLVVDYVGTGNNDEPSAVTIPATLSEDFLNAGGAAVTINGTNYVSNKGLVSLEWTWKNNVRLDTGFFIGSGAVDGAQIRGRMETGDRACTMKFRCRLESGSDEYTKLRAQTEGTAVFTITGAEIVTGVNHSLSVNHPRVRYSTVVVSDEAGLAVLDVTVTPLKHSSNGYVTVTVITDVDNIGS